MVNIITDEQLQKIYDIDCNKYECSHCKNKFGEKIMRWCPKSYADEYRDAVRTIESTVPVIARILMKMEE